MKQIRPIVIYDSTTENTKNIAEKISIPLKCPAIHIDQVTNNIIAGYNLLVIGSPVQMGKPTKVIQKFLQDITSIEYTAFFCTYGTPIIGTFSAKHFFKYMEINTKSKCIGKFSCPGFHNTLKTFSNRPNINDLKKAHFFGEKILEEEYYV